MIKSLKFSNFCSFKEESELNFEFDGKTPDNVKKGRELSNVMCIKGANSSGKTNLFKVLDLLSTVCGYGARLHKDERVYVDSYFYNDKPSIIKIEFIYESIFYVYEIHLTKQGIEFEELKYREKEGRLKKAYTRVKREITTLGPDFGELKTVTLKNNASVMALVENNEFSDKLHVIEVANSFFSRILSNVGYSGHTDIESGLFDLTKIYHDDEDTFRGVNAVIRSIEPSIKTIEIDETIDHEGKTIYFPLFVHEVEGKEVRLTINKVSSGIQKLYKTLGNYFLILRSGGILALDEFDIHLHPQITPLLLALFDDLLFNKNGAQLIISTHSTEILDILGKYRVILVDKVDNESFCYRLDELPIRNDRGNIGDLYIDGKLGGIPQSKGVDLETLTVCFDAEN
ncbi:ATP/GTP-binding protein [Vibrio lentus]|uniref:ATPase AAA-type core domain-containing protein n=1 Tax=Vibrio lentus TaxID=136468 RepID=A0A2N7KF11_9VIBR|nr:ATP-binding protein [Vibrio lentus]PMM74296.1 hypothetical protein BCT49_24215 [Vibrio lentus]